MTIMRLAGANRLPPERSTMYHLLASKLKVTADGSPQFNDLPALEMRDYNTARVEVTVFDTAGAPGVYVNYWAGNDAANWEELTWVGPVGLGHVLLDPVTVSAKYLLIRLNVAGGDPGCLVAMGVNLSSQ